MKKFLLVTALLIPACATTNEPKKDDQTSVAMELTQKEFNLYDENNDGVISREEFAAHDSEHKVSKRNKDFDLSDKDHDGTLSFEEFRNLQRVD